MIVYLVVLETEPRGIWVAAVVEEGHGGEDGPAHRNDVELGDVVVLQDALGDLQPVGGDGLEVSEQQTGDEHLQPLVLLPRARHRPEEPVELEALAHEDGLHRLLEQVLEVPLVGVDGQVVDGGVGGGVEHAALHHVVVVKGLLGVTEQGLYQNIFS